MDSGHDCTILWIDLMPLNCILQMVMAVNFILCIFHHIWERKKKYVEEAPAMWSARKDITIQMKDVASKYTMYLICGKQWGLIACLQTLNCLWGTRWILWIQTDRGHFIWVSSAYRAEMKVCIKCCFLTLNCCEWQTEKAYSVLKQGMESFKITISANTHGVPQRYIQDFE